MTRGTDRLMPVLAVAALLVFAACGKVSDAGIGRPPGPSGPLDPPPGAGTPADPTPPVTPPPVAPPAGMPPGPSIDPGAPPTATPPAPPAGEGNPATGAEPTLFMFDSPCLGTPDPDVAAGPTLVGTAIQWNAYFFTRDGKMSHMYKWGALRGSLVSDTHIVYDGPTKKWFMTTIVSLGGGRFGVQFMVSTDENAKEWKLSVPIEMPRLIDNPQPTVTADKVVITESGKCIWAVDKAALIAGNAPLVPALTCNLAQNDQVAAVKYSPEPPETAYAVVMANSTTLNWISTEGPAASAKVTEHKLTVAPLDEVPTFGGITQDNRGGLESGEVKAMWHKGHITWAKTFKCNGVSCVRHYDVDTAANTVNATDYAMEGKQIFFGGSGFDRAGNIWILAAQGAKTGFVGLALAGKGATGHIYQAKEVVKGLAGIPGSGAVRFGDYFSAAMDPVDGSTWLIGQWAAADKATALNRENNTGCKVVKVTAN
jgi:hypothetical protein